MLQVAIGFLVLAVIAMVFGAYGVAGVSMDAGKTLLVVFLVLAAVSFVFSLITGKKPPHTLP